MAERVSSSGLTGAWRTSPSSHDALTELNQLKEDLRYCSLSYSRDSWGCALSSNGVYSVGSLRPFIDNTDSVSPGAPITWVKEIPIKVSCFVWRAQLGRIPTAEALIKRGVRLPSSICSSCNSNIECYNHLLVDCDLAMNVWSLIKQWHGIHSAVAKDIVDALNLIEAWGDNYRKIRRIAIIVYGTLWSLWKARNDRVFKKVVHSPTKITESIKNLTYLWISCRGGLRGLDGVQWCSSPFFDM